MAYSHTSLSIESNLDIVANTTISVIGSLN